ncbi:MAG TPA: putative toxin-antitoxin system toxin component, PIN family [Saprospiraceae bacterium]|mgnify:CR=1 FL=1|nr:putative toxin-antitoxin system toxin component, PIN family [Saprospiraceae bacterium]
MADRLKVVIDTNIIVRSISGKSLASFVFDALLKQEFILCLSTEILLEYEEKLSQIYDQETAELVMSVLLMLPNVEKVNIYFDFRLIAPDADDDKFINCMVSANADYLVSDDRHFRVLSRIQFPKIECLTYEDFKRILPGS